MRTPVLRTASGSDIGTRYTANFDVAYLRDDPLLAVVADGMGSGRGSAAAGRTAVDLFTRHLTKSAAIGPGEIREAVAAAQSEVGRIGRELRELAGCTLTALLATEQGHWLVQVGDSRVYRLRDNLLELLTTDHTMAWLGAVHGWFPFDSPEAAAARYRLTRYIGHPAAPEPDILAITLHPGDTYLLCTDGVAEQVPYDRLHALLALPDPRSAIDGLLAACAAAGGNDNATAIVLRVD
ncbi:serine/threonine-protein phosphatase [Nocardia sp. 2]|uniref:Serine/threonine-protein phosphatase n=1 Tax=Nocardia acididurans TaxID=2802282 RepID=A0ABS1M376_9NOCA|nr:PP2C family serine/threonine-protein phosphatase [Nocardia acididurans]MBL1074274.1 serine/threonine-protein phosphatase [Nocardia acididurans]